MEIRGEEPLLANPYPLHYPSTSPKPNRVIRMLRNERVTGLEARVEKDYMVYRVRTADGVEGYVLASPSVIAEDQR